MLKINQNYSDPINIEKENNLVDNNLNLKESKNI